MKKAKVWTLRQVKQLVDDLTARSERVPHQDHLQKTLIQLCTSLSTIFLHHGLTFDALSLLRTATQADFRLYHIGIQRLQLWEGRIQVLTTVAYFFQR